MNHFIVDCCKFSQPACCKGIWTFEVVQPLESTVFSDYLELSSQQLIFGMSCEIDNCQKFALRSRIHFLRLQKRLRSIASSSLLTTLTCDKTAPRAVMLSSVYKMNGSVTEGEAKVRVDISLCFNFSKSSCASGVHRKNDLLSLALCSGRAISAKLFT